MPRRKELNEQQSKLDLINSKLEIAKDRVDSVSKQLNKTKRHLKTNCN